MVPSLLFDISGIDMDAVQTPRDQIEAINPHRGDMVMLDGVIWQNEDFTRGVAYKDIRDDEFWVAGHIPGRPLFPGVLMIEAGAQFASYMTIRRNPSIRFLGFVGVDGVKFRGQVTPGDRLIMLIEGLNMKPRRSICAVQGLVNGTQVFEARITGMPL